ncbi:MAG: hypothetical protein HOK41_13525 [Nitrospina sp.]|nr:hypothetical protein [Nitrospina sp.]MBT6716377.1 hypothetical protein [Nitrospina sp.]
MPFEKDKKKKFVEYLWTEINKAILTSPEVKLSIKQLQALGLLDYVSEYNLVLEVDRLIEKIVNETDDITLEELSKLKRNFTDVEESGELDFSFNEEIKENPNNDDSAALKTIPQVDGKLLSENETLFEEYLCKEFDEEQWLKQSKIRF